MLASEAEKEGSTDLTFGSHHPSCFLIRTECLGKSLCSSVVKASSPKKEEETSRSERRMFDSGVRTRRPGCGKRTCSAAEAKNGRLKRKDRNSMMGKGRGWMPRLCSDLRVFGITIGDERAQASRRSFA